MKKILSFLLILAMLVTFLSACTSENDNGNNGKDTTEDTSAVSETEEDESSYIDDYINKLSSQYDYEGETFTIIATEGNCSEDEELNGNIENDAMYNRTMEAENVTGMDIQTLSITDPGDFTYIGENVADYVTKDVMAGIGAYDMIISSLLTCGATLVNNGALADLAQLDQIDLSQTWWSQNVMNELSFEGKLYLLPGKINASHYTGSGCILFNKKLFTDFNIEEPYDIAREGKWTFDEMVKLASAVPSGSGTYRYGLNGICGLPIYFGMGYKITELDDDGIPYIPDSLSKEQIDCIDKLSTVFNDPSTTSGTYLFGKDSYTGVSEYDEISFKTGCVLFDVTGIGDAIYLRESDIEFGILPMPKKDAKQENYISFCSTWGSFGTFIPVDSQNLERSAVVAEIYGALSEKYLEPAYMEKSLKGRSVYDEDSRAMVDIAYNTTVLDMAEMYQWADLAKIIDEATCGNNGSLVSSYNISARLANNEIKLLLRQISKGSE